MIFPIYFNEKCNKNLLYARQLLVVSKEKYKSLFTYGNDKELVLSDGSLPLGVIVTFVTVLCLFSIVKSCFQKACKSWSRASIIWYISDT